LLGLFIVWTLIPIIFSFVFLFFSLAIGRQRARVFISFQHEREPVADRLATAMTNSGIDRVKLPFVDNPNHDILLDEVRQAIQSCDVFVCIPGTEPSFVESEVSMAFGLQKPLMFLLEESDTSRLPNTAKKGYPIFSLDRLNRDNFATLIKFCSYISADRRSTVQVYLSVLDHLPLCVFSLPIMYYLAILIVYAVTGAGPSFHPLDFERALLPQVATQFLNPSFSCFGASVFVLSLAIFVIFVISRRRLRTRIGRAISAKKFSETFLPKILDHSLSKANLLETLYSGNILSHHESQRVAVTLEH
jgi:hypothetical protein